MKLVEIKKRIKEVLTPIAANFGFQMGEFDVSGFDIKMVTDQNILASRFGLLRRAAWYNIFPAEMAISFWEAEQMVGMIEKKYNLWQHASVDVGPGPHNTIVVFVQSMEGEEYVDKMKALKIDSEPTLQEFCFLASKYLEERALPWLKDHLQYEAISSIIKEMSLKTILRSFGGAFPGQALRALYLLEKSGNSSKVNDLKKDIISLIDSLEGDPKYTTEKIADYRSALKEFDEQMDMN